MLSLFLNLCFLSFPCQCFSCYRIASTAIKENLLLRRNPFIDSESLMCLEAKKFVCSFQKLIPCFKIVRLPNRKQNNGSHGDRILSLLPLKADGPIENSFPSYTTALSPFGLVVLKWSRCGVMQMLGVVYSHYVILRQEGKG